MSHLMGRTAGLIAMLALGAAVLAGCGSKKASSNNNTPVTNGTTAPASQPSSSSGGGYGY